MTRRRMVWIALIPVAVIVLLMVGLILKSQRRPSLAPVEGRLRSCPDSPNCVCSFDTDQQHAITPIDAGPDAAATMNRLRTILQNDSRTEIVTDGDTYLHAEFSTPLIHFVDDVEFLLDESAGIIHVRSASRVGHSDLGANRNRIENLRERLQRTASPVRPPDRSDEQ